MQRRKTSKKKRSHSRTHQRVPSSSTVCMETEKQYSRAQASEFSSPRFSGSEKTLEYSKHPNVQIAHGTFPIDWLQHFATQESLAIDCETGGLDPKLHRLFSIQIATEAGLVFILRFPQYTTANTRLFQVPKNWIFHHAAFDVGFLHYHLDMPWPVNNWEIDCTKTLSKVICPGQKSGLGSVLQRELNIKIDKQINHNHWGDKLLSEQQINYMINDVLHLHKLRDHLCEKECEGGELYRLYREALRARMTMLEAEEKGYTDLFKYEDDLIKQ